MALILVGKNKEHLDFMMKLMDVDRNGTVEYSEFLEIMACLSYHKGINKRTAAQYFRALDKDGDGFLSVEEIQNFYEIMGCADGKVRTQEQVEELVQSLDIDRDGKINFEEFLEGINKF